MNESPSVAHNAQFIRVSGLLLSLSGALSILLRIAQFALYGDPPLEVLVLGRAFLLLQGIPSLIAATCMLLGATALYLRRARRADSVDLVAFLIGFAGLAASLGAMWTYAFTAPVLAREAPDLLTSTGSGIVGAVMVSMLMGQVGWLVIAAAAWRANAVPRWASIVAVGSSILAAGIAPFAQTPFLRISYNVVLGIGPLVVGGVIYAGTHRRHDSAHKSGPSRGPDA